MDASMCQTGTTQSPLENRARDGQGDWHTSPLLASPLSTSPHLASLFLASLLLASPLLASLLLAFRAVADSAMLPRS